jgi:hypothetical protein
MKQDTWRKALLWMSLLGALTLAATLTVFVFPSSALRPWAVMGFLSIGPGIVIMLFLPETDLLAKWMLIIAMSFTADILLATLFMYAGWWSPTAILAILLVFSGCGLSFHTVRSFFPYAIQPAVALRARRHETPPAS